DKENEAEASTNNNVDKVTRNYVETLVTDEEHLNSMRLFAVEWAHNNALIFRTKKHPTKSDVSTIAPCSLFPSPFPRQPFEQALAVQKAMNELYFRIGTDFAFLQEAYKDVIEADDHFRNMMDMLKSVHEEGIKQPITVIFQRADYMLNVIKGQNGEEPTYEIKQLEVNCGSIAGTSLDRHTAELNHVMLKKAGFHAAPEDLPENWPDKAQIESIKMAWELYGNPDAIVVIMISDHSQTVFDARFFETELDRLSDGKIKVARVTLKECAIRCSLDENSKLRLDGREVAVLNSRYSALGFVPGVYAMNARKMIERSQAIKIPSAFVGFSCSKKVQQLLAEQGMVERFFPNENDAETVKAIRQTFTGLWSLDKEDKATQDRIEDAIANPNNYLLAEQGMVERFFPNENDAETVKAIRQTFAGLWSLDKEDKATQHRIEDAIANPNNYVLKTNMECGACNYFDEQLANKLKEITPAQRPYYVLMQKLRPMPIKNIMIHPFTASKIDTMVSELGVYGVLLGNMLTKEVKHNVQQGHLLKTKLETANEGGISTGTAVHDSPILF
uniref:Glutathione synthetase n=1 Tax=Globodera pallida TaxID=36090 RepID=A0A183C5V6_GLOPA